MLFKSKLNVLVSLLFLCVFFISTSFSQNISYLDTLNGKFALQFQINENFSLSNFQGTVLSGKYHFSERDAIRLGVSLDFGDTETKTEITRLDTTQIDNANNDRNQFGITINAQYIHYIVATEDISFFSGIGSFLHYFNQTTQRDILEGGVNKSNKSDRSGFSTGLDLLLGVEWWFHKFMSLSAEYGLKFSYWSSENNLENEEMKVLSKDKSFNVSGNHINFGITVYF